MEIVPGIGAAIISVSAQSGGRNAGEDDVVNIMLVSVVRDEVR
jgi:hypothetical protein